VNRFQRTWRNYVVKRKKETHETWVGAGYAPPRSIFQVFFLCFVQKCVIS